MAKALTRPIRTKRDHKGASAARDALQAGREPAAERRLKALLEEIEKFDGDGEEEDYADTPEDVEGLPRRRWSDDVEEA